MRYLLPIIIVGFAYTISAQDAKRFACAKGTRAAAAEYLSKKAENDSLADQLRRPRKGKLPFCWETCIVSLHKPEYPQSVARLGIQGTVSVYTIADEQGTVIYAEPIAGPSLLRNSSREAACRSAFKPILNDGKRLKFPWTIKYNFEKAINAQIL